MTSSPNPPTALITGASSGIGACFARHLAAQGHRLVLVARTADRLDSLRSGLLAAGAAEVETLAADLADPESRAAVVQRLTHGLPEVDLLVNNAGIGLGQSFEDVSPAQLQQQLDVNVTAVLLLTQAVLPEMRRRNRGAIINVASVAGLVPNPGASYAGSKAWVIAFTEGLAITLRGTAVQVQALCPGLVRTDFHRRAGIRLGRTPSRAFVDVDTVVATSLADLRRGRVVSVPGGLYKAVVALTKVLPRAANRRLSARVYAVRD